MTYVHPTACVSDAEIGAGARVYQFASLVRGARIGRDTVIGPCAAIDGSEIGDRCRISYGVHMGPGFRIGNDVFLGPNVVLCNDAWPRSEKDGFNPEADGLSVVVEDGASIGCGAIILPGVRIGARALVAAGAVVTESVPANHLFRRDGSMHEILDEAKRRATRMRFAPAADYALLPTGEVERIYHDIPVLEGADPEEDDVVRRALA